MDNIRRKIFVILKERQEVQKLVEKVSNYRSGLSWWQAGLGNLAGTFVTGLSPPWVGYSSIWRKGGRDFFFLSFFCTSDFLYLKVSPYCAQAWGQMGGWKIKGSQSFLEQETLRFLLSQFHEQIRALFHKQTKIN